MTIDKSERAAVNKVIEALGDRATPAPRFDEFEVPRPAQSNRWTAAPLGVAVVVLMVIGALLLRNPGDDLIRQTTFAQTGERVQCQRGIRGVLPNGQGYLIQSTPELAGERAGSSAGIILDLIEGEAEPLGGAVVGIVTFDVASAVIAPWPKGIGLRSFRVAR